VLQAKISTNKLQLVFIKYAEKLKMLKYEKYNFCYFNKNDLNAHLHISNQI